MTAFAHKNSSADNSSHFLLTNKLTQFKNALTQYVIVQVKTWQKIPHHWITDEEQKHTRSAKEDHLLCIV